MSNDSIVKFRPFDKVECCFDIVAVFGNNVAGGFGNNVAGFGNNVERNFVLWTKSKQIAHVQFVSTFSKGRNFNNMVERIVKLVFISIRQCCFDIVAGMDGA